MSRSIRICRQLSIPRRMSATACCTSAAAAEPLAVALARTMMAEPSNAATDVAEQLGISVSTLYAYVNGEGQAKPRARKLLGAASR